MGDQDCWFLQVKLVCSAEVMPGQLFTQGAITLREEDSNRMLMDDLGLKQVSTTLTGCN